MVSRSPWLPRCDGGVLVRALVRETRGHSGWSRATHILKLQFGCYTYKYTQSRSKGEKHRNLVGIYFFSLNKYCQRFTFPVKWSLLTKSGWLIEKIFVHFAFEVCSLSGFVVHFRVTDGAKFWIGTSLMIGGGAASFRVVNCFVIESSTILVAALSKSDKAASQYNPWFQSISWMKVKVVHFNLRQIHLFILENVFAMCLYRKRDVSVPIWAL